MNRMILLLTLAVLLNHSFGQQTHIHGHVQKFNSKTETGHIEYLPFVLVHDSPKTVSPVVTNQSGKFVLVFKDKLARTTIQLVAVKEGWEVINSDKLTPVVGQLADVVIYMALNSEYDASRRTYANSLLIPSRDQYAYEKSELAVKLYNQVKHNRHDAKAIAKTKSQIASLNKHQDAIQEQLQFQGEQLAEINLDEQPVRFASAVMLVKAGNLDSAVSILQHATEKSPSEISLLGDLYTAKLRLSDAKKMYHLLLYTDYINLQYLAKYELIQGLLGEKGDAIYYYSKALSYARKNGWYNKPSFIPQVIHFETALGYYYLITPDYTQAKQHLLSARSLSSSLKVISLNDSLARMDIAEKLGILYSNLDSLDIAESNLREVLIYCQALKSLDCPCYQFRTAMTEFNIALILMRRMRYAESESLLASGVQLLDGIITKNSPEYIEEKIHILNSLGNLYYYWKRETESDSVLLNMYQIITDLETRFHQIKLEQLPGYYLDIARNMMIGGDTPLAGKLLDSAERLARVLVSTDSIWKLPLLATVLVEYGDLYYQEKQNAKAIEKYTGAIAHYRRIVVAYQGQYRIDLAKAIYNVANCLYDEKRFREAIPYYRESKQIGERLYEIDPQQYKAFRDNGDRALKRALDSLGTKTL